MTATPTNTPSADAPGTLPPPAPPASAPPPPDIPAAAPIADDAATAAPAAAAASVPQAAADAPAAAGPAPEAPADARPAAPPAADAPAAGDPSTAATSAADAPAAPASGGPASPTGRKFPWWIIAIAAALVAVAGVIVFVVTRDGGDDAALAPPPNVVNVAGTSAIQALTNAGFTTDPATASVDPCDAPVATQAVDGTKVTLTFAACNQVRPVPNLLTFRARALVGVSAQRLGFQVEVVQVGTAQACNPPITAQAPAPGTRTNRDSTIVVAIPAEPDGCNIVNTLPPENGRTGAFFAPVGP